MKQYVKVMLGRKSCMADKCHADGFIGVGFLSKVDFSKNLYDEWREFNKKYIPVYLKECPGKSRVAAGLSCGYLWTVCKGLRTGDVVLSPTGNKGELYVGEVIGDYYYVKGNDFPHRRKVKWYNVILHREDMSEDLQHSSGAIGTCADLSKYAQEIEKLIGTNAPVRVMTNDPDIEDPSVFAMEKYLEEFLVSNWKNTDLGKKYDIFSDEGETIGEQYPTDTGPIDILAISTDRKTVLVIELKRGQASDRVVGQIHRYMGYVKDEVLEKGQKLKGLIIGLKPDQGLKRALSMCPDIEFRRYKVDFKLLKD